MATIDSKVSEVYKLEYMSLRSAILKESKLTPDILDDVAIELQVNYEVYPFEEAKGENGELLFSNTYEGFDFMMKRGVYAEPLPPSEYENPSADFEDHHFYFVWAWNENNMAHHLLSGEAVKSGWDEKEAMVYGLAAALSAQKSYYRAMELISLQKFLAQSKANRSEEARLAAEKRHEKNYKIRAKAIKLYQAKTWPSKRQAAKQICEEVQQFAKEIGAGLSQDRAELTIYGWLLAPEKMINRQTKQN